MSPSKRELSRRVDALTDGSEHNEADYLAWFARVLRGEVDRTETPPEGLNEWFDTPAGQRAIDRSVEDLREARARVDLSEEIEQREARAKYR